MKSNRTLPTGVLSLTIAGLLAAGSAGAATKPAHIAKFDAVTPSNVLSAKASSWRDPAFGDMGWTHSSDWGKFVATVGQTVTITLTTTAAGVHPGITVWHRGRDDTAPNNYVVDHFYPQNANTVEYGAVDESTGQALGNIVMRVAAFGYDLDGNSKVVSNMHGIKDNVPGKLVLKFKVKRGGAHMFVVGGFNPDTGVDTTPKYDIDTTVSVTGP